MLIYKIFRAEEWAALQAAGQTDGAPVDVADGFVHFSTALQLPETLARHFAGEDSLTLLACDAGAMGHALRWEPSRGGDLFPHLYRPLRIADIRWTRPIDLGPDGHRTGPLE
ncbi:DUF952 domain-containing protein [Paracoccus marinaquae]|uniref:DUF952 domain-containing protein n=1 Tax=Paracoccus marinaquae TaxID=2841926 RepID=A0ABS6AL32_9RHOB|nr:DUF952 domain-containing protein [Paracoccus marinaquae]MBU3031306.1 DUF952 domain-containing protein [Paracoccus marinaquae]